MDRKEEGYTRDRGSVKRENGILCEMVVRLGEKEKCSQMLHNILQKGKYKETGNVKEREGTGCKGYAKQKLNWHPSSTTPWKEYLRLQDIYLVVSFLSGIRLSKWNMQTCM